MRRCSVCRRLITPARSCGQQDDRPSAGLVRDLSQRFSNSISFAKPRSGIKRRSPKVDLACRCVKGVRRNQISARAMAWNLEVGPTPLLAVRLIADQCSYQPARHKYRISVE